MFGKSALFPAYTSLDEISVTLPKGMSAKSLARNTHDLRAEYLQNPHIIVDQDPGIRVPLPDNGFDPRSLSETSPTSILFNRGSGDISEKERLEIKDRVQQKLIEELRDNESFSTMSPASIRDELYKTNPGSLLIYNGGNVDKLRAADALVSAVLSEASSWVSEGHDAVPKKKSFLAYLKPCAPIRDASVLGDNILRQRVRTQTQKVDTLDQALLLLGLDLPVDMQGDASLRDHNLCVNIASSKLKLGVFDVVVDSQVSETLIHACEFVKSLESSGELGYYATRVCNATMFLLCSHVNSEIETLKRLQATVERDLSAAGIDTGKLKDLSLGAEALESSRLKARAMLTKKVTQEKDLAFVTKDTVPQLRGASDEISQALYDLQKMSRGSSYGSLSLESEIAFFKAIKDIIGELLDDLEIDEEAFATDVCETIELYAYNSNTPRLKTLKASLNAELTDKDATEARLLEDSVNSAIEASTISKKEVDALKLFSRN